MEQILYPVIVWAVCGVAGYAVGNAAAAIATADAATSKACTFYAISAGQYDSLNATIEVKAEGRRK